MEQKLKDESPSVPSRASKAQSRVSWHVEPPPSRRERAPAPAELALQQSPSNEAQRKKREVTPSSKIFEPNSDMKDPTVTPSRKGLSCSSPSLPIPANMSPMSVRFSTQLRAWTKLMETSAQQMLALCESDLTRSHSNDAGRQDEAAVRRAQVAMSAIEFALLEFRSLLRRSMVETCFVDHQTHQLLPHTFPNSPMQDSAFSSPGRPFCPPTVPEEMMSDNSGEATQSEDNTNNDGVQASASVSASAPPSGVAWSISTRSPLRPRQAFETCAELLTSLQRYSAAITHHPDLSPPPPSSSSSSPPPPPPSSSSSSSSSTTTTASTSTNSSTAPSSAADVSPGSISTIGRRTRSRRSATAIFSGLTGSAKPWYPKAHYRTVAAGQFKETSEKAEDEEPKARSDIVRTIESPNCSVAGTSNVTEEKKTWIPVSVHEVFAETNPGYAEPMPSDKITHTIKNVDDIEKGSPPASSHKVRSWADEMDSDHESDACENASQFEEESCTETTALDVSTLGTSLKNEKVVSLSVNARPPTSATSRDSDDDKRMMNKVDVDVSEERREISENEEGEDEGDESEDAVTSGNGDGSIRGGCSRGGKSEAEDEVEARVIQGWDRVWQEAEAWVSAAEEQVLRKHNVKRPFLGPAPPSFYDIASASSSLESPVALSVSTRNIIRGTDNNSSGGALSNSSSSSSTLPERLFSPKNQSPLKRGRAASAELAKKDRAWRKNRAALEEKRLARSEIANERRRAAYEKVHSSSRVLRTRLEGRESRAARQHSQHLKAATHFAVNNNAKVEEVAWLRALDASNFQHQLQQRLRDSERRILETANRRDLILRRRAEKAQRMIDRGSNLGGTSGDAHSRQSRREKNQKNGRKATAQVSLVMPDLTSIEENRLEKHGGKAAHSSKISTSPLQSLPSATVVTSARKDVSVMSEKADNDNINKVMAHAGRATGSRSIHFQSSNESQYTKIDSAKAGPGDAVELATVSARENEDISLQNSQLYAQQLVDSPTMPPLLSSKETIGRPGVPKWTRKVGNGNCSLSKSGNGSSSGGNSGVQMMTAQAHAHALQSSERWIKLEKRLAVLSSLASLNGEDEECDNDYKNDDFDRRENDDEDCMTDSDLSKATVPSEDEYNDDEKNDESDNNENSELYGAEIIDQAGAQRFIRVEEKALFSPHHAIEEADNEDEIGGDEGEANIAGSVDRRRAKKQLRRRRMRKAAQRKKKEKEKHGQDGDEELGNPIVEDNLRRVQAMTENGSAGDQLKQGAQEHTEYTQRKPPTHNDISTIPPMMNISPQDALDSITKMNLRGTISGAILSELSSRLARLNASLRQQWNGSCTETNILASTFKGEEEKRACSNNYPGNVSAPFHAESNEMSLQVWNLIAKRRLLFRIATGSSWPPIEASNKYQEDAELELLQSQDSRTETMKAMVQVMELIGLVAHAAREVESRGKENETIPMVLRDLLSLPVIYFLDGPHKRTQESLFTAIIALTLEVRLSSEHGSESCRSATDNYSVDVLVEIIHKKVLCRFLCPSLIANFITLKAKKEPFGAAVKSICAVTGLHLQGLSLAAATYYAASDDTRPLVSL